MVTVTPEQVKAIRDAFYASGDYANVELKVVEDPAAGTCALHVKALHFGKPYEQSVVGDETWTQPVMDCALAMLNRHASGSRRPMEVRSPGQIADARGR
jgi:hypothetical protein